MVQETSAISQELNQLIDKLATAGNQFYELSSGLEKEVDSIRLVPLEVVYRRLRRPVRDAARQVGKLVDFVLRDGDLQIDRGLAEVLYSPLLHLVRNAVTHGIQTPDIREKRGKPRRGWVSIAASTGAGEFKVTVKDDGAGIDLDRVFAKGVKKRLIDPGAEPSQEELMSLIFRPGFSTSDKVNDLAGRGIGMDVVERQAKVLGGRVDVHTEKGHGTVISLRFPLPTAMSDTE
jgi:two-component system chemotaxis sensor kinase CheA